MMENWDWKVTNLAHQLKRPRPRWTAFPLEFSTSTQRQHRTAKEEMRASVLSRRGNDREGSKKKQWMRIVKRKMLQGRGAPAPLHRFER